MVALCTTPTHLLVYFSGDCRRITNGQTIDQLPVLEGKSICEGLGGFVHYSQEEVIVIRNRLLDRDFFVLGMCM